MTTAGFTDLTLECRDCKQPFVFEAGEQQFFAERNYSTPSRCRGCRQKRKAEKEVSNAGGGNIGNAPRPVVTEVLSVRRPEGGGGGRRQGGGRRRFDDEGY